jgi:quercetin dioxygenase-like cupin family protein
MKTLISLVVVALCAASTPRHYSMSAQAPAPAVVRTVLLQHDLAIPGYSTALVSVEIPVGGREGRHTHPGLLIAHVESGAVTLDYEGNPTTTYKAGDSFVVEAGKIHEGINNGTVPVKLLATFVVEKGKPLTTAVQ